jgi:hypothetical protein
MNKWVTTSEMSPSSHIQITAVSTTGRAGSEE